ncbi:MAG: extracellular solute-binding protein [Nitrospirae bacterium]|nr:extracellular solute-binding protein [Nitrospirota bacterium]
MNQNQFQARLLCLLSAWLCVLGTALPVPAAEHLVVYSGRAERLIKPVLDAFQTKTGIQVDLLSSGSTELVNRLQAEGLRTPADVFITNDAGSLDRAYELGLLLPLASKEIDQVIPATFRAPDNSWVGLSGRVWVLIYNTSQVTPKDLTSLFDLADPKWKGRIAIPNAGSEYLQAGVSVIQAFHGDDRTRRFLEGLKANAGTQVFGKSSQIVEAVAKGQAAVGIVNHYYIYRHLATQPNAPIAILMPDQQQGGMGAILNAAGVGIVKQTRHAEAATRLVEFLVSQDGQKMFADLNKEYPIRADVAPDPALPPRNSFRTTTVPLARLSELREPAMALIEKSGLR